ncbi:lactoylglutathione lyase [Nocardia yamanashiensis]|uniref:VOC family protein n=1 Tax=Nocardia yamanashiensis TaxID=209247 RepID=UPI001E3338E0|nr:VOC family protein [Nocardia yamanashiensis]UGT44098.1 lactoylglutathione lyase [Nocardia yamanashiensis]
MAITQIYVNLPVSDLDASTKVYTAMGGTINPDFTGDTSAQLVLAESIMVQLMTREAFAAFTKRATAEGQIEVINALGAESREEVDRLADAALAAGATEPREVQDLGWLYNRAIEDPDGHTWELLAYNANALSEDTSS